MEKKRTFSNNMLDKMVAIHNGNGLTVTKMIKEGKPYKAILEAASELMAEMIVMGTWGSHAIESGMIGSNVNKVVRSADIPVLTVTRQPDSDKFSKILIAVDPQFGIRELRKILHDYHKTYNPVVELLSIASNEKEVDELKNYLAKQDASLHELGIKDVIKTVRVGGIISDAILAYVNEGGHDMIWMETHGRSGISGWILGSVTEEVLQYSPVPVLSLHPDRPARARSYYHSNLPI
jgi:nucleotide-binding universal stress UspA family protein